MFLLGATGPTVMNDIRAFFNNVFVEFAELWFWPAVILGLLVLAIIVMIFLIKYSYENRILKSINKINSYFLSKPFITEENLVEFNLKMKKVPKVLRNNWQIYMLNREDSPTTYINVNSCVDKPLRTSSIEQNISNFSVFTIFLTVLAFIVGLQYAKIIATTNVAEIIFYAGLVPLAIVFLYTIAVLIFKASKNDTYSLLYDTFPLYERNLTKAVSTLPSYVDYEILFTKKEIKEGIPILQQYLEKRALIEQQELEKARANSMAVEEYDFAELGIDGSLVLERAMKECETFIRTRSRLQEECGQIEAEKENYKKNFELTSKDYQRKLQASRENLESLKSQQEASTNRIESNYIRKQQGDEIKKQQQLEKDNEEATVKFNEEQISLQQEIDKRKQEIEEKKAFVQQAMMLEFKHYANTLYKALTQKATEVGNQKLVALAQENADLKALLTDMQNVPMETSAQDGLIENGDVTSEGLYDMTASDEAQIQENRETSEAYSQEEEAFAQEQQAKNLEAQQTQIQADSFALQNNNGDNSDDTTGVDTTSVDSTGNVDIVTGGNDDNSNISDGTADGQFDSFDANNFNVDGTQVQDYTEQPIVNEAESYNVENNVNDVPVVNNFETNAYDTNNDTFVDANSDNIGNDDGGQQYDAVEEQTQTTDELEEIQKQIEEENSKLQKQKQEFENDLNDTISKMDSSVEEEVKIPEEKLAVKPAVKEIEEAETLPSVPRRTTTRKKPATSRSATRTTTPRPKKPRATSRVRTNRTSSTKKVTSEIDALNAEMQKLIDSTKNKD